MQVRRSSSSSSNSVLVVLATVVVLVVAVAAADQQQQQQQQTSGDIPVLGSVYRFLKSCDGNQLSLCIKQRALSYVDDAMREENLNIADGIRLVQTGEVETHASSGRAAQSESQLEETLLERVASFLGSRSLELRLPEAAIGEVHRALEEGRKKKKKLLMPLLLALKLKAVALIPLVLAAIAAIALKALVVGKIALVLAALIGLQKLLANQHSSKTLEVVAHPTYSHEAPTDHHSHYARASGDAHTAAYSAYAP